MIKKTIVITALVCAMLMLGGCEGNKILHCNNCNKELKVRESSNMTEDWTVYCSDCEELLGLADIVE